ncbi:MAG: branched-chain amino acid ABC transporter permease [Acidimicrobiales bacterium]|nr:branched-chain amino acid ABC transporter permease [Acidimicrobiales bacterium]
MELFLDQFFNGIGQGSVYASVALALVIIYRTTGLLNFAQGEMALFSTFVCWWFTDQGLGVWAALAVTVVLSFVAGGIIERVIMRPVEGADKNPLNAVIVTLGMFLAINALAALIFIKPGREALQMPLLFPEGELAGISKATIGRFAVLGVECLVLWVLLQKTKIGLALRAVASNPESSRLVGIKPGRMLMLGWAIAAAIGAVAGVLAASRGTGAFDTSLMQQVLVFAFAAAALGGFDSPLGAVVGGLIVGVADALTIQYVDFLDGIEIVVPFALILGVLLVRPNGLFGRNIVERV